MHEIQCFLLAVLHPPLIRAALAITGPLCGSKNCSLDEFCNSVNMHCERCDSICNDQSHNFDSQICVKQCQDYLHNLRYGRSQQVEDDIRGLKRQENTNTILLVVILIVLLILAGMRLGNWLRKKRLLSICFFKKLKSQKTVNSTPPTNTENLSPINIQITRGAAEAAGANVLSTSGTDISSPQTLTTPITTRYPAENNTIEYSYDNAALQVTPSTDKPRGPESQF